MSRPSSLAIAAIGVILLVASCTKQQPGSGSPTPQGTAVSSHTTTPNPTEDSSLPAHGAPKVHNPLDVTSFKDNPCQALTDEQVTKLFGQQNKVTPRPDDAEGPGCGYGNKLVHGGDVKVSFLTVYHNGLSGIYRQQEGKYKFFKELDPVHNYPAVAIGIHDQRDEGTCLIAAGVSDREAFGVAVDLSAHNVGKKDPCDVGHMVAGMVIKNIKGAQ